MVSRMNISVPIELRNAMTAYELNWSKIAQQAFRQAMTRLDNGEEPDAERRLENLELRVEHLERQLTLTK